MTGPDLADALANAAHALALAGEIERRAQGTEPESRVDCEPGPHPAPCKGCLNSVLHPEESSMNHDQIRAAAERASALLTSFRDLDKLIPVLDHVAATGASVESELRRLDEIRHEARHYAEERERHQRRAATAAADADKAIAEQEQRVSAARSEADRAIAALREQETAVEAEIRDLEALRDDLRARLARVTV